MLAGRVQLQQERLTPHGQWLAVREIAKQVGDFSSLPDALSSCLGAHGSAAQDDVRDAADLADLLRMDRLPEGWIAPPAVRELREMVRHRAKLVAWRSGLKAPVHGLRDGRIRALEQTAKAA